MITKRLKSELAKLSISQLNRIKVSIEDENRNVMDVVDFRFSKDHLCLDIIVEPDAFALDDLSSDDIIDYLKDKGSIETCCDCEIGWRDSDNPDCPVCSLKDEIGDRVDELYSTINDLKKIVE